MRRTFPLDYLFFLLILSTGFGNILAEGNYEDVKSSEGEICSVKYQKNEILDITGIEALGKAKFLAAKRANDKEQCAQLCCDSFTPEGDPQYCNTGVFFPEMEERNDSCFLVHCSEPQCGQQFILGGNTTSYTYVFFMKEAQSSTFDSGNNDHSNDDESSQIEESDSTPDSKQENEGDINDHDDNGQDEIDEYDEKDQNEVDEYDVEENESDNDDDSNSPDVMVTNFVPLLDVVKSSDASEGGSDNVGSILIILFICVFVSVGTVLVANKVYQHYQKRRLYDKLDYLSQEPLYSSMGASKRSMHELD